MSRLLIPRSLVCIAFVVLLNYPVPAQAEPITFAFTGTVESVFDGLGALDNSIEAGHSFLGSYTFDSETPNTAPPVDEGEAGLYHHEAPPAGVQVHVGPFVFLSVPAMPDFDVIVDNDFGFAGSDDYGFFSRNNRALGITPGPPVHRLDIGWFAQTFRANAFDSVDLPIEPPDLKLLGGGIFTIEGECTLCLAPAAFFRIEGHVDSLELIILADMDGDGDVDYDDVDDLKLGLINPAHYEILHGVAPWLTGDTDRDGDLDFDDIDEFVAILHGGASGGNFAAVPEPSSFLLAVIGSLIAMICIGLQAKERKNVSPRAALPPASRKEYWTGRRGFQVLKVPRCPGRRISIRNVLRVAATCGWKSGTLASSLSVRTAEDASRPAIL